MTLTPGEELIRSGDLSGARLALLEETSEDPLNPWLLYRLAWVCNRLELPDEAIFPAMSAWDLDPSNQWYLAEYLRALRRMEAFDDILQCSTYVRGGGVCRYYLALSEKQLLDPPWPSLQILAEAAWSQNDSTSSDACIWLGMILREELSQDSLIQLFSTAVRRSPDTGFYRCVLADILSESGRLDEAREHLHHIRLSGEIDYYYWMSLSRLAGAEGDCGREIWALRRARQLRCCPESSRNLGWALYLSGRSSLREGDLIYATERLIEASALDDSTELFAWKSDSLLELIYEFEDVSDSRH